MERSAIVIVIVSDFVDELHCSILKDADAFGKQIVPIILEGGDIKTLFFKGFTNLSKVRLRLKKEYDEYPLKTVWTEFCTSIIQLIPNSGVKVISYDRQHRIKSAASTFGGHGLSLPSIKLFTRLSSKAQLHEDYIKPLERGENEEEFVAFLFYGYGLHEDEEFARGVVLPRLNGAMQSLTGIHRKLICSSKQFDPLNRFFLEYEKLVSNSTVLIVFVGKHLSNIWKFCLQMADTREKDIVPMMFEGEEDYAMSVLKGIRNLSTVRIIWKLENGKYILKTSWRQVCKDILELAASSKYKKKKSKA